MFKIENLHCSYGDVSVLYDVNIHIEEGQLVGIIGSNGAGKTTLFKAVSGLIRPKHGLIEFLGYNISHYAPWKIAGLGLVQVPEGRQVFPKFSVKQNLLLGAYIRSRHEEVTGDIELVYELFPILRQRANQKAGTLSGGEQQMLAIGRGLMAKPKLLMLDEPSQGLSPILVDQLFETVKKINEQGITVFLSEQNVHSTMEIAHWVYLMENGRISLSRPGNELLQDEHVRKAYLAL